MMLATKPEKAEKNEGKKWEWKLLSPPQETKATNKSTSGERCQSAETGRGLDIPAATSHCHEPAVDVTTCPLRCQRLVRRYRLPDCSRCCKMFSG